ncbi:MAG: hypothetical protein HZB16_16845 [Armatimonadetes bacterium]|nr:hypothetical protein [Armatimonadota bacterium]
MRQMTMGRRRRSAGQALLLAVIVLLMLAMLAASVVAVVAGSARDTERDEASAHAHSLALAGIRYADEMLTSATEGADWRPALADYLTPANPAFTQQAYDNTYDSFEKLRGWDPVASGAPYYVKFRFAMDPDAPSQNPTVDPSQDFTDPDKNMPVENSEITAPHDHFLLRIEYAPNPANPESKAIKITAIGRPGANTNVFDQLVAYKPIGIQNYLLFVHDRTRRAAAAPLGVPGVDINGDGTVSASNRSAAAGGVWTATGANDFLPLYLDGPVRSNLDLDVHPPVRIVTTGNAWNDSLEVSGAVRRQLTAAQTAGNTELLVSNTAGLPTAWDPTTNATGTGLRVALGAPRLEAPDLDAAEPATGVSRFERLTRYSGDNVTVTPGGVSTTVNSGELGYGRGIYLDNTAQRDNLDGARQAWLAPENWGGRRYVPNGAIIDLYDSYTFPSGPAGPAIVITRTDGSTWTNLTTGQLSGSTTLAFRWPAKTGTYTRPAWTGTSDVPTTSPLADNGLVMADGNVRIRGRLPVSSAALDYHLTVVSRGSIYIEGSLLRPSDYGAVANPNGPDNTRIALLARDHVVLNPTVYAPGPLSGLTPGSFDSPRNSPMDAHYRLDAAGTQTVGIELPTDANTANLQVLAEAVDGDQNDGLAARASVLFHNNRAQLGQPYAAAGPWLLSPDGTGSPQVPGQQACQTPTFFADLANLARALYLPNAGGQGTQEYMPDTWAMGAVAWAANGRPNWLTVQAGLQANGQGGSQSDVLLKNLKVERNNGGTLNPGVTMTVSALMYAERGSFFVIPGDWFDARAQLLTDVKDGTAGNASTTNAADRLARLKRYNYQVQVNGAVAVNNLAELSDVAQWSDKWAYPVNGAGATLYNDYNTLRYSYDWGLRGVWPTGTPRANLPLLPALPLSTGLAYVGEEK